MTKQRHCIVALSTTGEHIQYVDLGVPIRKPYHQRTIWTMDLTHAMEMCGVLNDMLKDRPLWLHPNNRRNVPSKKVGGYEVVTENIECA